VTGKAQPVLNMDAVVIGDCGGFDESSRPLTGLGSGEWYESRFHRKCIDGGYADIGHRRGAVGNKDFLRHLNKAGMASNKRPPVEEVRDERITSAAAEAFCS
jgi:hypothetical protein